MTHQANFALPRQGYTHWWKLFAAHEQLIVLTTLLKTIRTLDGSTEVRLQALRCHFQQYLRMQNMFRDLASDIPTEICAVHVQS